jgi:D-alanyl-D-alanine dipeptidase
MRWTLGFLAVLAAAVATPAAARGALPPGFVYLRDVAPGIAQDMRYASADNFTGRPLPGYDGGECVLRRDAALALQRVEADLAPQHLQLKTYDCYRPTRAVRAMARWAAGPDDGATRRFYPTLQKRELFALGYIAYHSRHSTGIAVDLTLLPLPAPPTAPYDPRRAYGACTAPAAERVPDDSIDMGTGFDCFDLKSRTRSAAITPAQRRRRALLVAAMRRRGFKNYFREWWHFEFAGGAPRRAYDVPIVPRASR